MSDPTPMVRAFHFEMVGTAVFAITGVLVVTRRGLDIFGALVLGMVTALGGGTLRDLMIGIPIFWMQHLAYVWAALAGALTAFWIGSAFRSFYRALLYLDGLGAALFAVTAVDRSLRLGLSAPVAVVMGLLTGIGGGLLPTSWQADPRSSCLATSTRRRSSWGVARTWPRARRCRQRTHPLWGSQGPR